jgi:3-methyladenine DNA glycosylase AlkD
MNETRITAIREFCLAHAKPENVAKFSRYFKEGFNGYGIDQKTFDKQRDQWLREWDGNLDYWLDLGDRLMPEGKYEEKSFAISFVASCRSHYNTNTFQRIGRWFEQGVDNWATTDVLCMLVLSQMLEDRIITPQILAEWNTAASQWQRRAVPVALYELAKKKGIPAGDVFQVVAPLMHDQSEYVQKGIGTLLREIWKTFPAETEDFLMMWKDTCGRLIVQYATEKMDKEEKKKFARSKK